MLGFGIAWDAYSRERPGNIVVLGVVLFGAALLDFGHTLSYSGMPDLVTASSPGKAIGFWLPARLLVAVGLLVIALRNWGIVITLVTISASVIFLSHVCKEGSPLATRKIMRAVRKGNNSPAISPVVSLSYFSGAIIYQIFSQAFRQVANAVMSTVTGTTDT